MSKVILHIDMNAFFASCEIINNPSLKGKPIAVGSNDPKAVLSTASYEARAYGVNSAMPVFMAKKKCPNLIIVDLNFSLYTKMSNAFVDVIRKYSPIIEMASIDECFVDVTVPISKEKDPVKYIKNIQDDIYNTTGLPCSIGVAPTKFLAKMASDYKKPMGLTLIRKKDIKEMLYPLPIGNMFGVGKKSEAKLIKLGINTIGDFVAYEDIDSLKRVLGSMYFTLNEWINGRGSDEVVTEREDAKSISHSVTLSSNTSDEDVIEDTIRDLSKYVSKDAISEGMVGNCIGIALKDENFKTITRSKKIGNYIDDAESIYLEATKLLEKNYKGEIPIRLVGVSLKDLKPKKEKVEQMNLFDLPKEDDITSIINKINKELGYKALMKASSKK